MNLYEQMLSCGNPQYAENFCKAFARWDDPERSSYLATTTGDDGKTVTHIKWYELHKRARFLASLMICEAMDYLRSYEIGETYTPWEESFCTFDDGKVSCPALSFEPTGITSGWLIVYDMRIHIKGVSLGMRDLDTLCGPDILKLSADILAGMDWEDVDKETLLVGMQLFRSAASDYLNEELDNA